MVKPFHELRERLLRAGFAPRHVRRYLDELSDHFADLQAEELRAGLNPSDAESSALLRLGAVDDLSRAMLAKPHFRSWAARAPWAAFGLAPLFWMAMAYLVACVYLFAGWRIFLPTAATPFGIHLSGPIYSLENLYFQLGKCFYFASPVVVGWGIALIAARQRVATLWPMVSIFLITWIGSAAQIRANRFVVSGIGHVGMNIDLISSLQSISDRSMHALVIFTLAALPYLFWRWQQTRSLSA
jgi:hypothetical protein